MNIRLARYEDILDLSLLIRSFTSEAKYGFSLDYNKIYDTLKNTMEDDDYLLLVVEDGDKLVGMFFAMLIEPLFSSDKVAAEVAWYISPDSRGSKQALKLIDWYLLWAEERGATKATIADIVELNDIGKLYNRKGFVLSERSYVKDL